MSHYLDPLLRPNSIALVGASAKPGSYGNGMIKACFGAGFEGDVSLINPNYDAIDGRVCFPDLQSLPSVPDHAVLMVANRRIEAVFKSAIDAGVKAVTMFGSCQMDDGHTIPLLDRINGMAEEAGVHICGANGLGFYNRVDKVRCQMRGGELETPGSVALIAQSGSIWSAISGNDGRLKFNFTVSSGQEITTDASDYLEFAIGLQGTKAVGLYLETIRNPEKFVTVLQQAADADIPVVAVKVARSEQGKKFAVSHSGALAGDDAVYRAIFERYGALCVDDPDELVATLQLLSTGRRAASDGVVAMTDSGGERELLADIATDYSVPFAEISDQTRSRLQTCLEYGMEAENPLDAWGTGRGYKKTFHDSMATLIADPKAGLGIWVADLRDTLDFHSDFADVAVEIAKTTEKPLAFATCYSNGSNTVLANRLAEAGIPVLEGMRSSMVAARALLDYRTFQNRGDMTPPPSPSAEIVEFWKERCAKEMSFTEAESLALLAAFGIPVVAHRMASSRDEAVEVAESLGFPVVLKTSETAIYHKSDIGGVHLNLVDKAAVIAAYDDLTVRIGPSVLVSVMASPGVEVSFGFISDAQFGPVAMIGAGGTLVEVLRDTQLAIPPLDEGSARGLIDQLAIRSMLNGYRGSAACDVDALAQIFAKFSVLVATLGPYLSEIDVNPLIVSSEGIVAVDALIVSKIINNSNTNKE